MFPDRSPRIRHRNELTERDWENAVQGLGKLKGMFSLRDRLKKGRGEKRGREKGRERLCLLNEILWLVLVRIST